VPFDESHTTSYSPSRPTACLSHAVSEIQCDEKRCGVSRQKIDCHGKSLLGIEKNKFRSFIHSQSSAKTGNSVKIGQADVEIIGPREITENSLRKLLKKTAAEHIAKFGLL